MWKHVRRWYEGEGKTTVYETDPDSGIVFMPSFHTEYHWTARTLHALVNFYGRNWQFLWGAALTVIGLYLAYLALPRT